MTVEIFNANLATTTVSSGGTDSPSSGTSETWTVASSTGFPIASSSAIPSTQFHVADPAHPSEMIAVTNVSGTTWTVTRGADGTVTTTHSTGFTVYQVVTTSGLDKFPQVAVPLSGDETGVKDTAAINAIIQNGAAALLQAGTYYTTNLLVDTYGAIMGSGLNTILQAVSGTTGYMIALKTPATTKQITLCDFTLVPNTGSLGGILLDNTGFTPIDPFVPYDPLHSLEHVFVLGAGGDAFHFDNNARELRVRNCVQYYAGGYGFYLGPGAAADGAGCTDSHFTDCTSGSSVNHGWYIADTASNNMFTSCKSFYSGFNESTGEWGTTECGFEILGAFCTFVGCSAQQAALHGFDLNGCQNVTVTGCEADTNSAGAGVVTGVGINAFGTTLCSIVGNTGSLNTFDPPGTQAYGIQLTGTMFSMSVIGNSIGGSISTLNSAFTNGGQNAIIDPSITQLNYPYFLTEMGLLGLVSPPSTSQYFALLYGYDGSDGNGYAQPATVTGAGLGSASPLLLQMSEYAATSPVTIANTTQLTSLGSLTVSADDPVAGARYRVIAHGTLGTEATPGSATVDLRWGGTAGTLLTSIATGTTATALTASLSAVPLKIEGEVEFSTIASVTGWLEIEWRNSTSGTVPSTYALSSFTSPVTVTTASTEAFSLDWKWATGNAANTISVISSFERIS
jgi:hypothetical protein